MKETKLFWANCRLNIPRIRAEILDDQRGPIIKGPIVDRYCGQTRRPPVPKQHPVILKHGPPVHLDDTQVTFLFFFDAPVIFLLLFSTGDGIGTSPVG